MPPIFFPDIPFSKKGKAMRYLLPLIALAALSACSWETYKDAGGHTALRQKYPNGTAISYQDGTYSRNMRNNQYRPEQHAVLPENGGKSNDDEVRGTHWQKIRAQ